MSEHSESEDLKPVKRNIDSTSSGELLTLDCDQQVRAIKEFKGDDVDDLTFQVDDLINITKKDGAGWAFGSLPDGSSGWFPLERVELVHSKAVAEVGTKTGETALDAFIKEAKGKGTNSGNQPKKIALARQLSLQNFLKERPMIEQLVEQNILPSTETAKQISEAQQRLLKNQKKRKKDRADTIIENFKKGWFPDNPFNLTEDRIDRLVIEILLEIPVSKQKIRFTSYEDVFNGASLIQHLKAKASLISDKWDSGIPADAVLQLASNLLERNIIFNVADPSKTSFKTKNLYQLTSTLTDYTVLNLDKICHKPESPPNGYQLSIELVGEIAEVMKKYLPDFDALKRSAELRSFALHLSNLQNVTLVGLSQEEQLIMFINLYNAMVLFTHSKMSPPTTAMDRRFLYEHCSIYMNAKRYSVQELEAEVTKFATKQDPLVYFCLSDCTKSTPATYLFSKENYDMVKIYAARHFLNRALLFDSTNYEMVFPKMFQRVWKDLGLEKDELVSVIKPYLAREQREEIDKIDEIGQTIDVKFGSYSFEPSYVFEEASPLSPR